jgi:hypothetical protein
VISSGAHPDFSSLLQVLGSAWQYPRSMYALRLLLTFPGPGEAPKVENNLGQNTAVCALYNLSKFLLLNTPYLLHVQRVPVSSGVV